MSKSLSRYNISVVDGFVRESTTFRELSSNAKCILADILSMTNGDLTKTASYLDSLLNKTQMKIKLLSDGNMSDEEFYTELMKLKNEQRDTVDIIERLYLSSGKSDVEQNDGNFSEELDEIEISNNFTNNQLNSFESVHCGCNQSTHLQHEGPESQHIENNYEYSKAKECNLSETHSEECGCSKTETDENTTNTDNHHSKTFVRESSPSATSWRHHITVPEPFEMTKREESLKRIKNLQNENRCSQPATVQDDANVHFGRQFKAKPVPSHVYLPLYEKLMEDNALRREAVRAYRKEILKSIEKPFNFTIRENLNKERNDFSREKIKQDMNFGTDKKLLHSKDDGPSDPLNLPSQLYEKRFERMQEDLLLKQIKRHLRAQRLLQSASLPPGMEERQHRMNMRRQERKARDKRLNRITVLDLDNPETVQKQYHYYHPAPDFKQLHWKSNKTLRRLWKPPPEPTRPKSFKLRTSERANSVDRRSSEISKVKKMDENTSQSIVKQPVLDSSLPPALSRSTFLRENYIRNSLAKADLDAKKKEETEYLKRIKQKEVSHTMKETLGGQIISPKQLINSITEERKRQLIQNDLNRQAEYQRELNAIQQRVASKPLLLTRQSRIVARKRAEAKFDASIQNAGLNLDEIIEKCHETDDMKTNSKKSMTKVSVEPYDPENHFGDLGNN
uniref:Coiled-coil domain-containing protein n=1 Tax=Schistosoma mansoni TaxID=6183 RepID=A0A3Q0KCH8_SCHMA